MKVSKDFREFLELLNSHEVRFLIVGGYAVAFHSRPRYTDDIDIFIEAEPGNAGRIIKALDSFGFPLSNIAIEDLSGAGKIIQLGMPPQRIDIITSINGVSFSRAWNNRVSGKFGDVPVFYISFEDLLANKKASAREKDLADIQWIKKYSGMR